MCADDKTQITRDVLSYLIENPGAQDTLEGIVEWWLLEQKIRRQTARVREVLADLTANKLIVGHRTGDARTLYRVNRRKKKEILTLLRRGPV